MQFGRTSDVMQIDGGAISAASSRSFKVLRYHWRRLLRAHATPHEIALGCAAGVFAACSPFLGFQTMIAVALALILRVSVPAAVIGTFVGNPLSWPAIWGASYIAGAWMLGHDPVQAADHFAQNATALGATLAAPGQPSLDEAMVNLAPIGQPMLLGGVLIGLLAAAGSYYPTRRAARVLQNRRAAAF